MIPFTRRELAGAYRSAVAAATVVTRQNMHRLLLFYAAECGLKAVYLRRQNMDVLEGAIADAVKHDLNKILSQLRASQDLFLPAEFRLSPVQIGGASVTRHFSCGALNQAWRYGGTLTQPSDGVVEQRLSQIISWISKEIA